jgi:hypothetical protein
MLRFSSYYSFLNNNTRPVSRVAIAEKWVATAEKWKPTAEKWMTTAEKGMTTAEKWMTIAGAPVPPATARHLITGAEKGLAKTTFGWRTTGKNFPPFFLAASIFFMPS